MRRDPLLGPFVLFGRDFCAEGKHEVDRTVRPPQLPDAVSIIHHISRLKLILRHQTLCNNIS
jgi:hypothetical protein